MHPLLSGPLPSSPAWAGTIAPGHPGTAETVAIMARLALGEYGARHPAVRDQAARIVAGLPARDQRAEAAAVLAWVRGRLRYLRDPVGQEHLTAPAALLAAAAPQGDCDDHATLAAALLGALGIPTRFRTLGELPGAFSHVYLAALVDGEWVPLDPITDKPLGWEAPALLRWSWPINRADGFDPAAAVRDLEQATMIRRPPKSWAAYSGLADLSAAVAADPAAATAPDIGALPNPADWWRKHQGNPPLAGASVPGWSTATASQRKAWLAAMTAMVKANGAALEAMVKRWDTVARVTTAVATMGASELLPAIKAKWDEAVAKAREYKRVRAEALDRAAGADEATAARIRAAVAAGDDRVRSSMGILRPLLAAEAGLGNPVAALVAGVGGPAVLAALAALLAGLAWALSSVGGAINAVTTATGGAPWLLILGGSAALWWFMRRKGAKGAGVAVVRRAGRRRVAASMSAVA